MTDTKKPLIILSGPTAVGKTELSLKLAKLLNAEIISADSMQVYRGMDIGTAKLAEDKRQGIPHHLIDIVDPKDEWNVLKFKKYAREAMEGIYGRGRIPLVTGGTGFYIQALLYDVDFTGESDGESSKIREKLTMLAAEIGNSGLHKKLESVDPESAAIIHENNVKRVIRALEFYELNHYPISEHNRTQQENVSPYDFVYFVLNDRRELVYERIDKRVDEMLKEGLIDEVQSLMDKGLDLSYVSMQGLGYKEIYRYLTGEISLDEAVYILKRDTRHFAKRQLTWFRREKEVTMADRQDFGNDDEILKMMLDEIKEKTKWSL